MPKVEAGESREHYMERCMLYPDLQQHDETQRTAICEHLYDREAKDANHEQATVLTGDVRFEGDGVLRFEAAVSDVKPRIDRDKHMMYGVRIMNAKPTRKDYFYTLAAQQKVVDRFEGMVTGLDHDYKQGPPTIERSLGKVIKAYCDDKGTLGDIQYNPAHERMEQILIDAETGLNTISISAICTRCEQHGNEVTSFVPAGVDFVVNAAQTTKIFEQAVGTPPSEPAVRQVPPVQPPGGLPTPVVADSRLEQALSDIAALKANNEVLEGKLTRLEQIAPPTVAAEVARMEQGLTKRGVNLDQFHDDFLKSKMTMYG